MSEQKPSAAAVRIAAAVQQHARIRAAVMSLPLLEDERLCEVADAEIQRLIGALEATQWGNVHSYLMLGVGTKHVGFCPVCDQSQQRGHAPDCIVGGALENARGDA